MDVYAGVKSILPGKVIEHGTKNGKGMNRSHDARYGVPCIEY